MRRILQLRALSPAYGLTVEAALLRSAASIPRPIVRAWVNRRAVVIGRTQIAEEEVDLALCRRHRIPVLRRSTGGGAVVHHRGNLNLTVIVPESRDVGTVAETFAVLGGCLASTLTRWGVEAIARGSDLVDARGAKLGGAAQGRRRAVLWHTTLLVDEDAVPMRALRAHQEGYCPSRVASRPRRTTTITALLGAPIDLRGFALDATASLASTVGQRPKNDRLRPEEAAWSRANAMRCVVRL
jgi:lipoate-protein ligase A